MSLRNVALGAVGAALALGGAIVGAAWKARADSIPSPAPLYYAGTLTEGGNLVTGTRALQVNLYADATSPTPLCQTTAPNAAIVDGRFRIPLADTCKAQIHANPNTWVELVDGTTSLGRSRVGAVPYAVEADHAVAATTAASAGAAGYAADVADGGPLATTLAALQGQVHPPSGFQAWLSESGQGQTVTADGVVIVFDTVSFDLAQEYDKTTGIFTPRQSGYYLLQCAAFSKSVDAGDRLTVAILENGTELTGTDVEAPAPNVGVSPEATFVAKLTAGDQIACQFLCGGTTPQTVDALNQRNRFSAMRLY